MSPTLVRQSNALAQKKGRRMKFEHRELFTGPLPHPSILEKYEQTLPGAADRIIKMAENQSSHRQAIEKKVIDANVFNEKLGMVLAFIITAVIVVGSIFLIYSNRQIAGFISLVGVFILHFYNFYSNKKKENNIQTSKEANSKKS